jgi:radical SAM protein (TIGR01212 family)
LEERYRHLNKYLIEKFGERTLKICIDGGFTCPNRDGTLNNSGCIFCSERGSGELIKNSEKSIETQVKRYFESYRAKRANKFIVYFQNFTNTYDTIENLRSKYNASLIDNRIVGIEIATRPDCINESVAKLISEYSNKYYVCVELGLQTSNEEIGKIINRCYSNEQFSEAVKTLRKYNIDVVVHVMIGLPNETQEDIEKTVKFINNHEVQGIKIHSTYVVENTKLAEMYEQGKYTPISLEYYLEKLEYIITHLCKDIVLHRISGDAPKDLLIAPDWNLHKKWVLNGIEKILKEKDEYQGMWCER